MTSSLLPSSSEMAAFDAATIAGGLPALELCERAGRAITDRAVDIFSDSFALGSKVVVLCGAGNNGADGLVIARQLRRRRVVTEVIVVSATRYSTEFIEEAKLVSSEYGFLKIFPDPECEIPGVKLQAMSGEGVLASLKSATVVFDALLGSGQTEAPRKAHADLLRFLRAATAKPKTLCTVISVDIPTGIDVDSGRVYEPFVKADCTIAIECIKRGMLQSPAREACGRLEVVAIGIAAGKSEFSSIDAKSAPAFPSRGHDTNKGKSGRVLVVAGNRAMTGAPVLSGLGALRTGAGLVTVTRFDPQASSGSRPIEFIDLPLPLKEGAKGFSTDHLPLLEAAVSAADVIVFGPGTGRDDAVLEFTDHFVPMLLDNHKRAIVDADALVNLSALRKLTLADHIVITPHPGEASKILGCEISQVQADRYSAARALHEKTGAIVVLKGAATIVYEGSQGSVNTSANPWMATAGSGDALCGVVAALIGQGLSCSDAAKLGVYLHGVAGDLAHQEHNGPIIASDIVAKMPYAIGAHRRG